MANYPLNKILATVLTVGITTGCIWVVNQTHRNEVETAKIYTILAQISQKVDDGKENRIKAQDRNDADHKMLESKLSDLMSRREFDTRIGPMETNMKLLADSIITINTRVAKIEVKVTKE